MEQLDLIEKGRDLPRVRQALYGQPWCISEPGFEQICTIFERACTGENLTPEALSAIRGANGRNRMEVHGETAVIPITGPIFTRANLFTDLSGATSTMGVDAMVSKALADSDISRIVLEIDSPGGAAVGLAEVGTTIYKARGSKEIIAIANPLAASAAYWLGSQADAFFLTESAMVGSIGTLVKIDSADRMAKNAGIDSVIIRSSELKAAGTGPLTPNQAQDMARIVGQITENFKAAVLRGRPGIDIEAVSTGQVWVGSEAVKMGLADGVASLSDFVKVDME